MKLAKPLRTAALNGQKVKNIARLQGTVSADREVHSTRSRVQSLGTSSDLNYVMKERIPLTAEMNPTKDSRSHHSSFNSASQILGPIHTNYKAHIFVGAHQREYI